MAETGGAADEVEVTLDEVLHEEETLVDEANAVYGGSSVNHCSYEHGYMRQGLYACLTCAADGTPAGICLACSLKCHADHDLVELYTKRHFRCDCGTSKLPSAPCALYEGKDKSNDENVYSQNFRGLYCSCHRPYPDPDRKGSDEAMHQCIVCEDWYHENHLFSDEESTTQKPPASFDELVCRDCMTKHVFLYKYVDVPTSEDAGTTCRLPTTLPATTSGPTFWQDGWRQRLCRCKACVRRYEDAKIAFLMDETDALSVFEAKSKASAEDMFAAGQKAVQTELSHTQQIEMAVGYARMASSLKDYLAGFAESGQTVKAEDIHGFFETLQQNKRQKRE
ncbi:hypothetical protein SPRG_18892 [Saprolegnia parasitica CBS 223.65]|uniref:UBR-type domain-containing protein n=1 Tax=Saprolegnia parasitica (strain CBS 223.65) TaxID=695850 RepID=A0A067D9T4_SAPPC|nr:hypothetical protein SPRG_18892 [Saprolegnia parasitica CBS 223.65]KDO35747.1 hypothetical protein SPRG_18892 [Saprolegnia parasitica CBS 223.65]|eukprot:XP_012194106.1 hypothetical protein SPRG_18892 [Saprolegnia parasitica CBS 223.65]